MLLALLKSAAQKAMLKIALLKTVQQFALLVITPPIL